MTKEFKEKIIKLRDEDKDMFYTTSGNIEAYKLCVKHISAAPMFGYGLIGGINDFIIHKPILIVDFEEETITEIDDQIIPYTPVKTIK